MALRAASLFAGVGGLDLALKLTIPGAETVLYIERDSYSAATLVARMEDAALDQAPIWSDITTFDGRPWRGVVDLLIGGFPCQDISVAGKGVGIEGKRSGLWSEIVRLADEIRPRYIFLENVSAITSRGLDVVLADLAEGGFDAEWLCLRASAVGAPHRRERWFCLAVSQRTRRATTGGGRQEHAGCELEQGCGAMANPKGLFERQQRNQERRQEERTITTRASRGVFPPGATVDDASCKRRQQDARGAHGDEEADEGWRTEHDHESCGADAVFPPGPNDHETWRAIFNHHPHLAPAIESSVRLMADGQPLVVDEGRADQLRCSGNGCVALQAAVAFRELMQRARLED